MSSQGPWQGARAFSLPQKHLMLKVPSMMEKTIRVPALPAFLLGLV